MRRSVIISVILIMAALTLSPLLVMAEDSSASAPSIVYAEQKENSDSGEYYLFIDFSDNLNGMGEVSIPETGFSTMYNIDSQSNKSRLVLPIGSTPYDQGTYTLVLTGATEFTLTFDLVEVVDVSVICVMMDGSTYESIIRSGSTISVLEMPEAPEGYVFDCWMDGSLNRYHEDSVIDRDLVLFPIFIKTDHVSEDFQVYMKSTGSGSMNIMVTSVDGGIIADGKLSVTFYYTAYDDFVGDYTTNKKVVGSTLYGDGTTSITSDVEVPKRLTAVYSASATFTSNSVSDSSGVVFC